MTGPENYREAERLLSDAAFIGTHGHPVSRDGYLLQPGQQAALIARAQVHADLANAAATALNSAEGLQIPEYRAWHEVAGEPESKKGGADHG